MGKRSLEEIRRPFLMHLFVIMGGALNFGGPLLFLYMV